MLISDCARVSQDAIHTNLVFKVSLLGNMLQYVATEVNSNITGRHDNRVFRQTVGGLHACSIPNKHLASTQQTSGGTNGTLHHGEEKVTLPKNNETNAPPSHPAYYATGPPWAQINMKFNYEYRVSTTVNMGRCGNVGPVCGILFRTSFQEQSIGRLWRFCFDCSDDSTFF